MITDLVNFLEKFLSPELVTVIVGALPISELRGAIPLGIVVYKFMPLKAFILAICGNLIPVVPVLFTLNYLTKWLIKFNVLKKFFTWWFDSTKKRSNIVEKYEALGLAVFVAIPLPMTGAWTGCVAAYLFRIKFRYAILAIVSGVLAAGMLITFSTIGLLKIFFSKSFGAWLSRFRAYGSGP